MLPKVCAWITVITVTKIYWILPMHSNITIKNVSWPQFSWPTLYNRNVWLGVISLSALVNMIKLYFAVFVQITKHTHTHTHMALRKRNKLAQVTVWYCAKIVTFSHSNRATFTLITYWHVYSATRVPRICFRGTGTNKQPMRCEAQLPGTQSGMWKCPQWIVLGDMSAEIFLGRIVWWGKCLGGIFQVGRCLGNVRREFVRRKRPRECSVSRSPRRTETLAVVPPWLTHTHTQTAFGRLCY